MLVVNTEHVNDGEGAATPFVVIDTDFSDIYSVSMSMAGHFKV